MAAINVKPQRIKVGRSTVATKGPKIGNGGNTVAAPKILKKHRFPKIRGI